MENKQELIRVITRSVAFLIPLAAGCVGMFILSDVRDTLVGFVMGAATAASVFYFKKSEDE
ncbi:hypothetical protein KAX02_02765 [candidate division WOR-3 bacterium]|nr:hypothetical protein [candidate division WOR-3 bacterium]